MKISSVILRFSFFLCFISHAAWAVDSNSTTMRNYQLNRELTSKQMEQQFLRRDWISLRNNLSEYRLMRRHDPVLADFIEARVIMEEDHRPDLALPFYERILAEHPNYHFVRVAYAQALFADKQYALAEEQFAQLPENVLSPQVLKNVQLYRDYIRKVYQPKFSLSFHYEHNSNINSAGESDTISACLFNYCGLKLKKGTESLPISDDGIRWSAGVTKLFHINGLHNIEIGLQTDGIHYFKHSEYNEQSIRPSIAYINRSSRRTWSIEPYANYQFFGGSIYKRQYGLYHQYQLNLTPNWQWRLSYDVAKTSYNLNIPAQGNQHFLSSMLIYQGNTFYVFGGAGFGKENNEYKQLAHNRQSIFAGAQYIWNEKFGVRINGSINWRQYKYAHFFSPFLGGDRFRRETSYYANVGIFSPKIQVYGFMPILNMKYIKTSSNIPDLYNRDSWSVDVSVQKTF